MITTIIDRRRAIMSAKRPIYQIQNVTVSAGASISTGVQPFVANKSTTILFDFTANTNPTGATSLGSIHKLLQMGTTRELCIGKYSRQDATLSLWWMPTSNADHRTISDMPSAAGRKRFAITHHANSNEISLKMQYNNGTPFSMTATKTFTPTDAVLSAGYYTNPLPETNTAGLPSGTINKLAIYDRVLSEQEISAFFA